MAGPEAGQDRGHVMHLRAHDPQRQCAARVPGEGGHLCDGLLDALVRGLQPLEEQLSGGSQPDLAAGALEERGADGAFLLLDRLADAGRCDVQAFGAAAEVELLRERQEYLDVPQFHSRPP